MKTISVSKNPGSPFYRSRLAALKRGNRFTSFAACCGEGYHKTPEAAEKAARRKAHRACPGNPPNYDAAELAP